MCVGIRLLGSPDCDRLCDPRLHAPPQLRHLGFSYHTSGGSLLQDATGEERQGDAMVALLASLPNARWLISTQGICCHKSALLPGMRDPAQQKSVSSSADAASSFRSP